MKIEDYECHKIDAIMYHVFANDSIDILPVIPPNSWYTHLGTKRWELKVEYNGRLTQGILGGLYYNDDRVALSIVQGFVIEKGTEAIIKFILKNVNLATINGSKA
jgi:hypothetical protein